MDLRNFYYPDGAQIIKTIESNILKLKIKNYQNNKKKEHHDVPGKLVQRAFLINAICNFKEKVQN